MLVRAVLKHDHRTGQARIVAEALLGEKPVHKIIFFDRNDKPEDLHEYEVKVLRDTKPDDYRTGALIVKIVKEVHNRRLGGKQTVITDAGVDKEYTAVYSEFHKAVNADKRTPRHVEYKEMVLDYKPEDTRIVATFPKRNCYECIKFSDAETLERLKECEKLSLAVDNDLVTSISGRWLGMHTLSIAMNLEHYEATDSGYKVRLVKKDLVFEREFKFDFKIRLYQCEWTSDDQWFGQKLFPERLQITETPEEIEKHFHYPLNYLNELLDTLRRDDLHLATWRSVGRTEWEPESEDGYRSGGYITNTYWQWSHPNGVTLSGDNTDDYVELVKQEFTRKLRGLALALKRNMVTERLQKLKEDILELIPELTDKVN